MIAGGTGGTCGDMLMHSLDTVKTRQQGDPRIPPKYATMGGSYATIYKQEGLFRGLYGGVTPALFGSFPGTVIFFGTYEYTKRTMIDAGINPNLAYLSGGKRAADCLVILSSYVLIIICRILRRSGCLHRLRAVGGVEDAVTAAGPL